MQNSTKIPKLIAFDLDGTVWYPDMYMLWGGGTPFVANSDGQELLDRSANSVKLLGICSFIFHELKNNPYWLNTKVAWVSCTDEPVWAEECLHKFKTSNGESIHSVAHTSQIFKSNKQVHFRKIKAIYPDIDFSQMLFFDNEIGNIKDVSKLGVKCVHCPSGITEDIWKHGLDLFN